MGWGTQPPSSILTLTCAGLLLFGMTNVSASVVGSLDQKKGSDMCQNPLKMAELYRKIQIDETFFPIIYPDGKLVGRGR